MEKINKVVITAAGTGSRLLPFTKEIPKEMMPIYDMNEMKKMVLKPVLQVIYESIYNYGVNKFCFIVGRGKHSVEDHFLTTEQFGKGENSQLKEFYNKINKSDLVFVQQSIPKGFGDAVYRSKFFVGNDSFLMHAGDDVILSKNYDHLRRLEKAFLKNDADMAFLVTEIDDPRSYGVIEGDQIKNGIYHVKNMEEKPDKPKSNLAVIATYLFKPSIFEAIEKTKPDKNGEIQLATAAQKIIKNGKTVAVKLKKNEKRIDVGTPKSFLESLKESYNFHTSINK